VVVTLRHFFIQNLDKGCLLIEASFIFFGCGYSFTALTLPQTVHRAWGGVPGAVRVWFIMRLLVPYFESWYSCLQVHLMM
jgi:hypothetical protein